MGTTWIIQLYTSVHNPFPSLLGCCCTMKALIKLHSNFIHPSTGKICNLLKRAYQRKVSENQKTIRINCIKLWTTFRTFHINFQTTTKQISRMLWTEFINFGYLLISDSQNDSDWIEKKAPSPWNNVKTLILS